MKIGIDVSQLAYENTGVANYLEQLIEHVLAFDHTNEYILFFSSMRKKFKRMHISANNQAKVTVKQYSLPPRLLDLMWNKLHIFPIEWFIGSVDVFITSDWTDPPSIKAKKLTILYDLIVFKHPDETDKRIVATQKRKLDWAKKESAAFLCISEATKKDAQELLAISSEKLFVIYPGLTI